MCFLCDYLVSIAHISMYTTLISVWVKIIRSNLDSKTFPIKGFHSKKHYLVLDHRTLKYKYVLHVLTLNHTSVGFVSFADGTF